ncbi:hypothetical protein CHS0354_019114 [Potamilus streckersoni]|uniref:Uncharacterized protein n=1 Tax=Potamilus streckersoni TaxID=2493646 RepID=A0AAE0SZP2_9BIVA|nr:hypothetical protein CHS0354_019114 [Potamilus streckersoni]
MAPSNYPTNPNVYQFCLAKSKICEFTKPIFSSDDFEANWIITKQQFEYLVLIYQLFVKQICTVLNNKQNGMMKKASLLLFSLWNFLTAVMAVVAIIYCQ